MKTSRIYICASCDAQSTKWSGRCLECGGWGTMKPEIVDKDKKSVERKSFEVAPAEAVDFSEIKTERLVRLETGIGEFDRVLGGGFVPGSLVMLSGEPGIGKSTILGQVADAIAGKFGDGEKKVIYVSGEESAAQIKTRLERLGCQLARIACITETNVEKIIGAAVKIKPALLIIDSIQTVHSYDADSEPGSVAQIRASAAKFLELAKRNDIAVILIGHITKDGLIAGPKLLEHLVDAVVYLESETKHDYRILRAFKNRFGSVNELGIFEMTGAGFKEIKNPSSVFISASGEDIPGSVISCVMEGTRPFLAEIQALVTKTVFGYPQRKASGFDLNRLQVLSAVLTKRAGINLSNQDVIMNIVGGLKVNDPALDLAVCLAVASSLLNRSIDRKTIALGEVGLGGEVRNVSKLAERLKEAEKLGFTHAYIPDVDVKAGTMKLTRIKNLSEIVKRMA